MLTLTADALILDVFDLHERDRVVAFLTAEHGQKRGAARGARTKYSRFAGQLQPLAKARVTWFEKEGRELVRVNDVSLVRPAAKLQTDLEGILLGAYLAEHMKVFAPENEAAPRLFRLLDTTTEALIAGCGRALAARYYEIWMLRLSGIFPVPRECPACGREITERAFVLPRDAEIVCASCGTAAGGDRFELGAGVVELLRRSGRENLAELGRRPPSEAVLARTEELCARVRRAFLQDELKSYQVMRRTLAGI